MAVPIGFEAQYFEEGISPPDNNASVSNSRLVTTQDMTGLGLGRHVASEERCIGIRCLFCVAGGRGGGKQATSLQRIVFDDESALVYGDSMTDLRYRRAAILP